MSAALALAATALDVLVMTQLHPRAAQIDGPRHVRVAVDTLRAPLQLPDAEWRVRVGRETRTWRGALRIAPGADELAIIVRMPIEEYVARAVAAETEPGAPPALLEAQAIVSRSYALAARGRHGAADACDLAHCQALRESPSHEHRANSRAAADRTAGQVLVLADGRVARTPFHAACGGSTADPRAIFGRDDVSGAAAVPDPGCSAPGWEARLPRDVVERAAIEALGSRGPLSYERAADGRVVRVLDERTGRWANGDAFARALDRLAGWGVVRGSRMWLDPAGAFVRIRGTGIGHGAGLCQAGALRRARQGQSVQEILSHYFPNARWGRVEHRSP
ncbi:MAG: SpoIID/LytB domain-containing protein [Acidobacteria bacterium]|nr:SpoIID/LytB domain-containing protein [Acidobacteriota bacterium]